MKPFRSLLVILLLAFFALPALGDGFIIVPRPPHPPHPIPIPPVEPPIGRWPRPVPPPRVYPFAPMRLEQHHVTITIKDQIAVTEVDQVFHNPNNVQLEGEYIFPLPRGAQIDKFSMDINGKLQDAELLDADKARQIYTNIVRSMKDPALMEFADRGLFKVRIFPIEPNGRKQVKVRYTQVLKNDSGLVGYTYPLSTEKFSAAPIPSVAIKCAIETKQPIKTVYSPSHKVEVNRKGDTQAVIGWETKNDKPDTDFQVFFSTQPPAQGEIGVNLLAYRDDRDDGHFMLFISPGNVADTRIARKDIVFVLDTSGSMAGEKLEQARRAMKFCIANLNDGDRFEIIRFSTEAEPLFEGLREADKEHRAKAATFIESLRPIGGTAIEDALKAAVKTARADKKDDRPAMIIFLTDGRPTIGATDENQLVDLVKKDIGDQTIRIFSFGIGTDINTHLLDRITEHTRAASQYVLPDEDLEVKVSSFFTKINHPVLSGVELKVTGDVRLSKMHPSSLPDVFRGDQLIVMGRYTGKEDDKSADGAIQLTGTIDGQKKTFTYEATFPGKAVENTFVPRLWATRRVGFLLDQIRLSSPAAEVREEITQLAKQYGIVTPYTSYLILEDEARQPGRPPLSHAAPGVPRTADRNRALREEAGAAFDDFRQKRDGSEAVGGAKAADALKQAQSGQALADADLAARRGIATAPNAKPGVFSGPAAGGGGAGGGAIHVTRFVEGRTFYFNGATWIDALSQNPEHADAKRIKIAFGSEDYFKLLAAHKQAGAWFALGTDLIVALDGAVYEIAP